MVESPPASEMDPPPRVVNDMNGVTSPESKTDGTDMDDMEMGDSLAMGEIIYRSLDPLDPRKVSLDIFELYCHEMLATPHVRRRAYLAEKMRVSR